MSWLTRLLGIDQGKLDRFQDDWQRRATAPARFVNQNVVQPVRQDIGNFTRGAGAALGQIPAGRIQRDIEAQNAAQQAQLQARIKREQDMAKRQQLLRIQQRSLQDAPNARAAALEGAPTGREVAKGAITLASFALPGATIPKAVAKASPAVRLLGSSAIRGAEGAAYGAAYDVADGKKAAEIARNVPRNFAFGAAANAALSPKLTGRAIKEVPELVRDTRAATQAVGRPGMSPAFAKVPSTGKLPERPVVEPQGIPGQKPVQPEANMPVKGRVPTRASASQQFDIPARNQAKLQSQKPLEQPFSESIAIPKPEINTSRLNVSPEAKQRVTKTAESIRPELEAVKGRKLTNDEVVEAAKTSDILQKGVSRDQTKKATAAITKLRQAVSAGAEGQGISREFIENLQTLKAYSADAGRTLQAFSIGADPTTLTVKERVVKELLDQGLKIDDLLKAAEKVDFDNPSQVNKFYRQFVKPKIGEIIDEYRYTNLLSSPQTHIVNAFSNMLQGTVVSPVTKLYTGGVDFIASALTGKERTAYASEVPAYTKGFVNAIGEGIKNFADVVKGNKYVERPDIDRLPTGVKGLQTIPRILEASDIFFRTLIKAGEKESLMHRAAKSGQEIAEDVLDKQAAEKAAYFVFRGPVDPSNQSGQGMLLSGIDAMTNAVYGLRKVPGVKWFIPFVQTPMNILKQGIEYSPAGLATLPGAANKTEQIAKALMGSTVLAGAGMLAMNGDSTWAAPTSTKEKELFYASGRKPYSVKIGDKWYSYSKLGPLAYPIALATAIKYEFEQNPKAQTQELEDKIGRVIGDMAGFFSDQSYLQGIGDIVRTIGGDASAAKSALSNIPRQLVPLTSLQGWVARMIDPVYRKGETFTDSLKTGIPGLSKSVPAYTDPLGRPSKRAYPVGNSFSPIQVTPESGEFEGIYQQDQLERQSKAIQDKAKKDIEAGNTPTVGGDLDENMYQLPNGKVGYKVNNEIKTADTEQEARRELAKHDFGQTGETSQAYENYLFYLDSSGDVKHTAYDTPELAQKAYAKDQFERSGESFREYEDVVFRRSSNGSITTEPKIKYEASVATKEMYLAKYAGDYNKWLELAKKKHDLLTKQLDDPTIDELDKLSVLEDIEKLENEAEKYQSYGGAFKKPKAAKKAKRPRAAGIPDLPSAPAAPRASIGKRGSRVAMPSIARPRVSASYLASGR